MMAKLKSEDWSEVATDLPSSTWRVVAAWKSVTSGPNAMPHRKKAA